MGVDGRVASDGLPSSSLCGSQAVGGDRWGSPQGAR